MAFNCTLMAPHGGIFVFPVVDHAVMYFLALIVGTVLGAVALGLLKKKVEAVKPKVYETVCRGEVLNVGVVE